MWNISHNGVGQSVSTQEELHIISRIMREWNISYIIKQVELTVRGKVERITGIYDGK